MKKHKAKSGAKPGTKTKQRRKPESRPAAKPQPNAAIKRAPGQGSTPAATAAPTSAIAASGAALNPDTKQEYIGIYDQAGALGRVIPDDRREIREITILPGSDGGAKQGDRVVAVLASGNDGRGDTVRQRSGDTDHGKTGVSSGTGVFGRVTEVLGAGGDLAVAEKALIRRLGLRQSFSDEQLALAGRLNRTVDPGEAEGRLDLRDELLVTIDGDDTRDIDDAVSLSADDGKWRLGVHIADVSHYVKEGSILDQEAFARGTSVYFPDMVLPMLPPDLSNGICSLNEGVDRLAVSCLMTLNKRGAVTGYEIRPSLIRVRERLTYAQVQGYLNRRHWSTKDALAGRGGGGAGEAVDGAASAMNVAAEVDAIATGIVADTDAGQTAAMAATEPEQPFFRDGTIGPMLLEMAKLCMVLRQNRLDRGALDFELPECKISPGACGKTTELKRKNRILSEMIIEELMIAANETVAAHYQHMRVPFPYRVHEGPGQDKAGDLELMLRSLGLSLRESPAGGGTKKDHDKGAVNKSGRARNAAKESGRAREAVKKSRMSGSRNQGAKEEKDAPAVTTASYKRLLAEVKGKPEESIVSTLLLRSMNHASYSVDNRGHFGLASSCYCHFTSPIRRYPDLMVHRMIKKMAKEEERKPDWKETLRKKMDEQCQETSIRERIAEDAERKADSLWKADYMSQFVGEEYDGVISGVTDFGFYVSLENTAEGLVHISRLEGYYEYVEEMMTLVSRDNPKRYRLGDNVRVLLESVDVGAGYINFRLAEADTAAKKDKH